jgi:hypothetical protein
MKRVPSLSLFLIVLLFLAACGNSAAPTAVAEVAPTNPPLTATAICRPTSSYRPSFWSG